MENNDYFQKMEFIVQKSAGSAPMIHLSTHVPQKILSIFTKSYRLDVV